MNHRIKTLSNYIHHYEKSIQDPEAFWGEIASIFQWKKPWKKILSWNFEGPDIKWFDGAQLNITENIFERLLPTHAEKTAILWEPNNPNDKSQKITYQELFHLTCQFSNVLESHGVKKGDRVIIYMPMIPEAAIAMLACARVGAIHSVVFAGF